MKTPNTIEDEIDAIRQKIHEETKHMTFEQRMERLRRRTDPIIRQFNMKVVASVRDTPFPPGFAVVGK